MYSGRSRENTGLMLNGGGTSSRSGSNAMEVSGANKNSRPSRMSALTQGAGAQTSGGGTGGVHFGGTLSGGSLHNSVGFSPSR
jgi:hypothetical protein